MAKTILISELPPPTGVAASLVAGGTLVAGTTYYYRMCAVEYIGSYLRCENEFAMSVLTAEVSATTDATNRSIKLDWTGSTKIKSGNYLAYIILRTTTAGDYSNTVAHAINAVTGDSGVATTLVNAITYTDTNARVLNTFQVFPNGIPMVEVDGGTTSDRIDEEFIYQAYVTQGKQANFANKVAFTKNGTGNQYFFRGCFLIGYTTACCWKINSGRTVSIEGRLNPNFSAGMSNFIMGSSTGNGAVLGVMGINGDGGNGLVGLFTIYNSKIIDLATAEDQVGSGGFYNKAASLNSISGTTGSIIKNCQVYMYGANCNFSGSASVSNSVIEMEPRIESGYVILSGLTISGNGLYSYAASYVKTRSITMINSTQEIQFHGGASGLRVIDLIDFTGTNTPLKSGSISNPTLSWYLRRWSMILTAVNSSNAAIQNVAVSVFDDNGLSSVFTDSASFMSGPINNSTTSIPMISAANVAIGDVILVGPERMLVTNKVTNTLTVTRGYQGTIAQAHIGYDYKVWVQKAAILTDANGVIPEQYLTAETYQGKATGAPYSYDTVVYTPHTIVVAKYGYQSVRITQSVSAPLVIRQMLAVNTFVAASESTAAAYTGIAINGAAKTITTTEAHTLQELYDYTQWWAAQSANMQHDEPITTVDGQTFTLASGWVANITGGTLTDPVRILSGTLAITANGFFEDRTGAIWDVAGTLYYGAAVNHTIRAGATPAESVNLAYYSGNTNLTCNASRADVISLTSDTNGLCVGYAVWRIGATTYNSHNLLAKGYGYRKVVIPKTVTGSAISDTIQLTSDPYTVADYATAGGYTGVAIVGDTSITMSANRSMQELYDYSQWWDTQAANLNYSEAINTADGSNFNGPYDLIIDAVHLSGSGSENLGSHTLTMPNGGSSSVNIVYSAGTQTNIVLTNLVAGSRVQLYDLDTATELCNAISAGDTYTLPILWTENHSIRIRIMLVTGATAKKWLETTSVLSSIGMSYQVNQEDDAIYNAIAIDGSTVTECSIVGTALVINVNDADNTTQAQRLYAYEVYWLFTEGGIRDQELYIEATDSTHLVFEGGLKVKNSKLIPLQITGANIVPVSGPATDVMDLTGGPIFLNFNRVEGFAYMTQGGLTTEEHDALLSARAEAAMGRKLQGNKAIISVGGDVVTIYDDDGTTPLHTLSVAPDRSSRTPV